MKLLCVVLHLGKSLLEATVEDQDGHRRRIQFSWITKEPTDIPESHWVSSVAGEVEYQRTEDANEAKGRKLPF